jgi:hypothetical protein
MAHLELKLFPYELVCLRTVQAGFHYEYDNRRVPDLAFRNRMIQLTVLHFKQRFLVAIPFTLCLGLMRFPSGQVSLS